MSIGQQQVRFDAGEPTARRGGVGRTIGAGVALVLFLALTPVAIIAGWIDLQLLRTDAYVAAVGPVIEEPNVQEDIAMTLSAQLGDLLSGLVETDPAQAGAVTADVGGVDAGQQELTQALNEIVAAPDFSQLWANLNREAHRDIIGLLRGERVGLLLVEGEDVILDFAPVVDLLTANPESEVAQIVEAIVPPDTPLALSIFREPDLILAERFVQYEGTAAVIASVLAVGALVLFLWLARNRWRALGWAGFLLAVIMFLSLVGLLTLISNQLTRVQDVALRDLATEYVSALLASLAAAMVVAVVIGLVVAVVAWIVAWRSGRGRANRAGGAAF